MILLPEFFGAVKEFLKIAPGLILLPLTGYLAWKKINNKILVSFSTYHSRTSATRIGNVVFSNLKDKPVPIFSVYAIIDRHISIKVEEFNPPIILKGLESLSIETSPVSNYYIGADEYEPSFMSPQKIELYVTSIGRPIKCKLTNSHSIESYHEFKHYSVATASTRKLNGFAYNDNVLYAIIYNFEGKLRTAFVEQGGFIGNEWGFYYNMIPEKQMESTCGIIEFLKHCKYDEIFTNYKVISPTKHVDRNKC
ncbi:hypothetical protein EJ576_05490 [Pseudomonas sp. C 49-2]|jgi:hypothetical protein|uniref:hypothetical protein n=1 Tax=Pseudomonas TaxID=286 RepID=UPI000F842964|nr:hypothetical protein [Pseudomonas sp. C 49-2]RTY02759.1 hypothetical protein EJ576_05490 [Pseudomonas sp. C 49-2]